MSAAYRDLFINTSRPRMEYSDFPMPESYPDFPHHTQIAAYFEEYVDHFGFRDRITFETGVEHAARERGRRAGRSSWTPARRRTLRRADRRQRPPLEPALARTGVPRLGHVLRASSCTRTPTSTTRSSPASGSSCWAWATRRWTSPWSPPTWPSAPTSPRARASGSSPSTSSANRSTRSATTRGCRSRSASG